MRPDEDTTRLLSAAGAGDADALDLLFDRLYDELRLIARARLRRYRPGETLNTTALVHEAYVKLVDGSRVRPKDRAHFLALASRAMRFVLVRYAEAAAAQKRGGGASHATLDELRIAAASAQAADLLSLNEALERLARHDERLVRVVECRFFGGLTYDEIAESTGLSVPTVKRDWARARGWLHRFMEPAKA